MFIKIFKILLQSVVFLFLFLSVFIVVTSKTNLLAGIKSFVVLTGSMEPALPAGSVVFIRPSDSYRTGDVISFKNSSGMTVTHRIVASSNGFIRTAGDANKPSFPCRFSAGWRYLPNLLPDLSACLLFPPSSLSPGRFLKSSVRSRN